MGFDAFFSRLYILLYIFFRNIFGYFGLGKYKLIIFRSIFHCKNAGVKDFIIWIFNFWFLGFPGNPGIIWILIGFFLGYIFWCIFILGMFLDILVLENVN